MKTFLRENKTELLFLGLPILCLIVLWSVNFYKLSYEHDEWKNLGMPFNTPVSKLGSIEFPYYDPLDILKSDRLKSDNFIADSPVISVWVSSGKMYSFWQDSWWTAGSLPFPTQEMMEDGVNCAARLQNEWKLPKETSQSADMIEARGLCNKNNPQYAVYQIKQNGEIWEKHVDGRRIIFFRKSITVSLLFFLIVSHSFWIGLFNINPIRPKPDYGAS
ncbi:MAG: hypothetical protein ACOYZ6_14125 [Chloroflexota bacterium]